MKRIILTFTAVCMTIFAGCRAVYNAEMADPVDMSKEASVVFTRTTVFSPVFGSYSISEFVEITYCNSYRNAAEQMVVEVGIRYHGPTSWTNWWKAAPPQISLKSHCVFFKGARSASPAVYSTNNQNIVIKRGETYTYKAVCPRSEASSFQLVLGGYND